MKYEKRPLNLEEHINILKERKLDIPDEDRAKKYLMNVGYFRLSGYMYHLQINDGNHKFKENISFDDIIFHYHFDKKLRAIFTDYLERIEVCLRAKLTDYYSVNYGFYWFTQYDLFDDKSVYEIINKEIIDTFKDPQERFLKSFKLKYTSESLPPSNMALEILTLGKLSRLYKGLSNNEEKINIVVPYCPLGLFILRMLEMFVHIIPDSGIEELPLTDQQYQKEKIISFTENYLKILTQQFTV